MAEDAKEVKEILDVVSEKVPKLLNDITDALFSAEKAEKFGESVARFYKSMIDSGMKPDQAFELTKQFMDSSSPGGLIAKAIGGGFGGGHGKDDECCDDKLDKEIEKKVKEKIARKLDDE